MFGTYRTLLALMVVALHLGGVPVIGGYAVFGFYILSGYLMTLIMQTSYGYTFSGMRRYAENRFLRIYPMYWLSVLFSLVLIYFVGEDFSSNYHAAIYFPSDFTEIIRNILLFFPFIETPRLTPPAWALTVEIFFYILIGLGLSKNRTIVLYWVAISVSYHVVALYLDFGWKHRYFTIAAASLPFSAGAFIYYYKQEMLEILSRLKGRDQEYLPYVIFCGILLNWFVGHMLESSRGVFFYSNFVLCAIMVVVLCERKTLPYLNRKFDKWMGDFSYPIYLIHYQVGLVVVVLLGMAGFTYERPDLMLALISIPFVFLVSWGLTVTVEKPIEVIRARIKKANKVSK
ncbi:acyltransferase [Beggiatoa alba]|nr:acyltransferase [bacterium AH-315-E07]MBN4081956.1 acyltransferase [Beggiatoa alba]